MIYLVIIAIIILALRRPSAPPPPMIITISGDRPDKDGRPTRIIVRQSWDSSAALRRTILFALFVIGLVALAH